MSRTTQNLKHRLRSVVRIARNTIRLLAYYPEIEVTKDLATDKYAVRRSRRRCFPRFGKTSTERWRPYHESPDVFVVPLTAGELRELKKAVDYWCAKL